MTMRTDSPAPELASGGEPQRVVRSLPDLDLADEHRDRALGRRVQPRTTAAADVSGGTTTTRPSPSTAK